MPRNPPSYGQESYWDEKYRNNPNPFDWLLPPSSLEDKILSVLHGSPNYEPKILHIGCGTSLLSFSLRKAVQNPTQVHNLDFSAQVVEWGRHAEENLNKMEHDQGISRKGTMDWMQTSLLSLDSIRQDCRTDYSLIVDKSCADAIACGENVSVRLPYPLHLWEHDRSGKDPIALGSSKQSELSIHPLHILALNLAYISLPGSEWIALSYSGERFNFLLDDIQNSDEFHIPTELLNHGFPDPRVLWILEGKTVVNAAEVETEGRDFVHRPKTLHWLYVLRRTDVMLEIK